jgi:uncharacterized membrane protein (DUF485 family)
MNGEWEASAAGRLGLVGVGAAIVGTVFMAGDWWIEAFAVPWLADAAPASLATRAGGSLVVGGTMSFALFAIGWVLFAIASFRARVFPPAISIAIGGLLSGVPGYGYLAGGIILGFAVVSLGTWMMRRTATTGGVVRPAAA